MPKKTPQAALAILELLAEYSISPCTYDRLAVTARELLASDSAELADFQLLIQDSRVFPNKDTKILLEEFLQKNNRSVAAQNIVDKTAEVIAQMRELEENWLNKYFYFDKNAVGSVILHSKTEAVCQREPDWIYILPRQCSAPVNVKLAHYDHKPLVQWDRQEFLDWRKSITNLSDENLGEVLAVLAAGTRFVYTYYPRDAQILAVVSWYLATSGGLLQVATGEGKSDINRLFASLMVFAGHRVDVLTSALILAKRDAENSKKFYDLFAISVDYTNGETTSSHSNQKPCYEKDVLYGRMLEFIGDSLRDDKLSTKMGRGFDVLIIDEADAIMIDQLRMKVQLSGAFPGFEILKAQLTYLYYNALDSYSWVDEVEGVGCMASTPDWLDAKEVPARYIGASCDDFVKDSLRNHTLNNMFAFNLRPDERMTPVPAHLQDFLPAHLERWIESLQNALYFQQDHHYVISQVKYANTNSSLRLIAPVDVSNTGEIQRQLRWDNGLHPLLEVKHSLAQHAEGWISIFQSQVSYIMHYKGQIYGATGTLGGQAHHDMLQRVYNVGLFEIPSFANKNFVEFTPLIVNDQTAHIVAITQAIFRVVGDNRAGLVIFKTVKEVQDFRLYLLDLGFADAKIFTYAGTPEDYDLDDTRLGQGDVVIATNLAGRGADIKLKQNVLWYGGLHVILTTVLESSRADSQNFGRGARKGEPGSAQVIAYDPTETDYPAIVAKRNNSEAEKMSEAELCLLPQMLLSDQLFNSYLDYLKIVRSPTGYVIEQANKNIAQGLAHNRQGLELTSQHAYVFSNNNVPELWAATPEKTLLQIELDWDLLAKVKPDVSRHIKWVLAHGQGARLSGDDQEWLHFIMASKNISLYPVIAKRAVSAWQKQLVNVNEADHLAALLAADENADLRVANFLNDEQRTEAVKLRALYALWQQDRTIYNNEYEERQITENWATWLKQRSAIIHHNECKLASAAEKEQTLANHHLLENQLFAEFAQWKAEQDSNKTKDILLSNPSYFVLKAWHFMQMHALQSSLQPSTIPDNIKTIFGIFGKVADKNSEILQQITTGFWNFASFIFSAIGITINPPKASNWDTNYAVTDPLGKAIGFLDKAIYKESLFSWPAHNAMSNVRLLKDGSGITQQSQGEAAGAVVQKYADDAMAAHSAITNTMIPFYEAQMSVVALHDPISGVQSDLYKQLIGTNALYGAIQQQIERNIDRLGSLGETGMIRLGRAINISELAWKVDISQALQDAVIATYRSLNVTDSLRDEVLRNLTSQLQTQQWPGKDIVVQEIINVGGLLFEIDIYQLEPEDDDDWWGTFFSGAIGILKITVGVALASFSGPLGLSLISGGIGDVISCFSSVINGQPIPIDALMNSQGMALGITIVTAGILHLGASAGAWTLGAVGGKTAAQLIVQGGLLQLVSIATDAVFQHIGNQFIDREHIQAKVEAAIERLVAEHQQTLILIYAHDVVQNTHKRENNLLFSISSIVSKFRWYLHEDGLEFAGGVATGAAGYVAGGGGFFGIGLGSALNSGLKFAKGVKRNDEAIGKITSGVAAKIEEIGASSSVRSMLATYFRYEVGVEEAEQWLQAASTKPALLDNNLTREECQQFSTLQVSNHADKIIDACERIAAILLQDYSANFARLKALVTKHTAHTVLKIHKDEIVGPLASLPSQLTASKLAEQLYNFLGNAGKPQTDRETYAEEHKVGNTKAGSAESAESFARSHPELSKEEADFIYNQMNEKSGDNSAPGVKKIPRITVERDAIIANALQVLDDHYGSGNVPKEAVDRLRKGEIVSIKEGRLDWVNRMDVPENHAKILALTIQAEKMVRIAHEANEQYGTSVQVTMLALQSLIAGPVRAGIALLQGFAGNALLEPIKDKAIVSAIKLLIENDPFLSKAYANNLATAGVEGLAFMFEGGSFTKQKPHKPSTQHDTHTGGEGRTFDFAKLAKDSKIVYKLSQETQHVVDKHHLAELNKHEAGTHGGHTIKEHVAKDQAYLEGRLHNSNRNIRAATSYPDQATAEKAVLASIAKNEAKFLTWAKDHSNVDRLQLTFSSSTPLGYGVSKANPAMHSVYKATTLFAKDNNGNVYIVTSYPDAR